MKSRSLFWYCFLLAAGLMAQTSTEATLLGKWSNPDLPGSSSYNNTYNEIWGLAVAGREYAVIGSTAGTHFIEVTDPSQPVEVAFVAGRASGPQIIHRDYHNYGCYLYAVSDEGSSSLQIMDVSYLPDSVPVVYDRADDMRQAHNIFIDTTRAVLYAFAASGGPAGNSPMRLYDISSPTEPVFINEYNQFGELTFSHFHDGWVDDGYAYLNGGYTGMVVVDFDDPTAPVTLGILDDYVFAGYNHSGWPTADGNYYYLGDENHGYDIKVLDVSDPAEMHVVNTFSSGVGDSTITHNQIVACNYLYVSYYYDGLRVYDISDRENPEQVLFYDTSDWPFDFNYRGAWGVYPFLPSGVILVSDMQEGLFVFAGPQDQCEARDKTQLNCSLISGVEESESFLLEASLYPQPANTQVQLDIQWTEGQQKVKLALFDMHGRKLWRSEEQLTPGDNQIRIPLSRAFAAGTYILRLSDQNRTQSWRIIKQ